MASGQADFLKNIDASWTLFLDRDGVINTRIIGGYVTTVGEFVLLPGVLDAIAFLSSIFGRVFVVTNQQGIGKGLMSVQELDHIHAYLIRRIEESGGRIDKIYFAPHLASEGHPMRKPDTGMARLARQEYPEVDFSKSIMAGDTESDMRFGKAAGMYTVFVGKGSAIPRGLVDLHVISLLAFARLMKENL